MVDLTDAGSPFQQSIPDFAFYVPAIVVFTLAGELRMIPSPPHTTFITTTFRPLLSPVLCMQYRYSRSETATKWVERLSPSEQLSRVLAGRFKCTAVGCLVFRSYLF
ncbi:GM16945 [Drosophila sechellia]|uniref:GM16945 n=1 Tax=Drosophila sechellia TaxID=7238 RepID=B4IQ68_DROSE|nr:GM19593 [Drosophila sechellia]EDW45291.1 GM16945 [Drosophila sechellia]